MKTIKHWAKCLTWPWSDLLNNFVCKIFNEIYESKNNWREKKLLWFYSVKICHHFGWHRFIDINCTAKKLLHCGSKIPPQRTYCSFLTAKEVLAACKIQAQVQEVASLQMQKEVLARALFLGSAVLYQASWYEIEMNRRWLTQNQQSATLTKRYTNSTNGAL